MLNAKMQALVVEWIPNTNHGILHILAVVRYSFTASISTAYPKPKWQGQLNLLYYIRGKF